MKTVEQKAKAYDETIGKLQGLIDNANKQGHIIRIEDIENSFPELKESEDERIRKDIIEMLRNWASVHYITKEQFSERMAWLEKQGDKDKLIQELGEYKVKYIQEVLEKHLKTINKDDERLRKTTIAFLKDFAEQGYENAIECIDWLENHEQKPADKVVPKFKVGDTMRTLQEDNDGYADGMPVVISIDNEYYHCTNELIAIKDQDDYEFPPINVKRKSADKVESLKERIGG